MSDRDPEPIDTSVSTEQTLRVIRSAAENGLKRETERESLEAIKEVCDNILSE
jgi:hypothetical protein